MTFLTVKEIATRLQVKDKTIYAWVSQDKIPCIKVNGVIRFNAREIEQWLEKCSRHRTSAGSKHRSHITSVDTLIESAKRAIYTSRGETSDSEPIRKGEGNGAR